MKDTVYGIIGDNLELETLENLCVSGGIQTGPFGSQLHQKDYLPVGTPIITVEHLGENRVLHQDLPRISDANRERLARYIMRKGDIIFSRVGSVDRRALVRDEEDGWLFSGRCLRVRPDNTKIDSDYLSWFFGLEIFKDYIRRIAVGATMPSLNTELLSNVPVIVPPLPEQRAIAGILGALDDKIELNRRMNRTLESMARAVFRQWFVQGEEVRDWAIGRLGDFMKINERSITKDYPYDEIEYVDISSVSLGHLEGTTTYSLNDSPSRAKRLVKHGDTIWSTVRPNRKSYLFISNPQENLVVSTGFAVLTSKTIPASFLYFFTTTEQFVDYLVSNADGSAYPAVLPDRFADVELPIPPDDVLNKFESVASPMLAYIAHNEKESRTLASLRDTLLPRLMRGEVRVSAL